MSQNCKIRESVPLFISKDFDENLYWLHFKKYGEINIESIVIPKNLVDEYLKKYEMTTRVVTKMRIWNIHSKKTSNG